MLLLDANSRNKATSSISDENVTAMLFDGAVAV